MNAPTELDPPVRLRDITVANRYGITRRLAREWLRRLVAAGVATKLNRMFFARLTAVDAWVLAGGKAPVARTRKSPSKAAT